jgi:hypothetical protein
VRKGVGKTHSETFFGYSPTKSRKTREKWILYDFLLYNAVSIFALNIEIEIAYYRRNTTRFQENPVFSRASRIKTMQQVSNILGILETILKNIPRKPVFSRGLKKIKKSYKKVLNF